MAEQRDLMTVSAGCRRTLSRFATGERAAGAALRALADWTPAEAELDRYGKGELASRLEDRIAALLGKEAAVWLPSGTMAQQIALRASGGKPATRRHSAWSSHSERRVSASPSRKRARCGASCSRAPNRRSSGSFPDSLPCPKRLTAVPGTEVNGATKA